MPRAEAKLLAIDDVSRVGSRACAANLGGCCWVSAAWDNAFAVSGSVDPTEGAEGGFSCWKRRIWASCL